MKLLLYGLLTTLVQFPSFALWQAGAPIAKPMPASSTDARADHGCVACHEEVKSQPATSMAYALETVEECKTLSAHPLLTFKAGRYSYSIERRGDQSIYSVSDGVQAVTMPIRWAMGASSAFGQTYLVEEDGRFYESRVSYFTELNGLDITPGQEATPTKILQAAGRRLEPEDASRCFGCHATNTVQAKRLSLSQVAPGVQCGRCHGSTEKHLAAIARGDPKPAKMKNLSKMSTEQISNFCGQCHRTREEVTTRGRLDINDVRFQPYRLAGSKCYDADDRRISCLACHDPHQEVDRNLMDYDSKCNACHAGGKRKAKPCKVATNRCASCHMPRIEAPGAHHRFADHRIRIVKINEPFPG